MNTIQVTASQPCFYIKSLSQSSKPCLLLKNTDPLSRTSLSLRTKTSSGLPCLPILKSQRPLHVCLAGGKGMMENSNEDLPWKSLKNQFKGQSIEDALRQQIQKGEYYKNGGSGPKPPGGGGGGGGGGPGGSDDGGFAGMSNETRQVILAAIGFIFLYVCAINGVELAKLGRDYIIFLFWGKQSVRLKRAMYKWVRFYKNMTEKKEVNKSQVEKAPTWNNLDYYRDVIRSCMKSNSNE